jgi:hypothetical protein
VLFRSPDGILDVLNDYDGDGWSNGLEFSFGTNPIDPLSHPTGSLPVLTPKASYSLLIGLLGGGVLWLARRAELRCGRSR